MAHGLCGCDSFPQSNWTGTCGSRLRSAWEQRATCPSAGTAIMQLIRRYKNGALQHVAAVALACLQGDLSGIMLVDGALGATHVNEQVILYDRT